MSTCDIKSFDDWITNATVESSWDIIGIFLPHIRDSILHLLNNLKYYYVSTCDIQSVDDWIIIYVSMTNTEVWYRKFFYRKIHGIV